MVRISVLNDALKNMVNAERKGKRQVLIRPSSKVVVKFLTVMMKHGKLFFLLKIFSPKKNLYDESSNLTPLVRGLTVNEQNTLVYLREENLVL